MKYIRYILVFLLLAFPIFAQENATPDETFQKIQFNFTGAWLPDMSAVEIGPSNFQTLQNLRYADMHPEGISGYSKVNSTTISTYTNIRSGIQLRSDHDKKTYVLVHAENSAGSASQVFQSQGNIGVGVDTGTHTDGTGSWCAGTDGSDDTKLCDATASWTADEWINSWVINTTDNNSKCQVTDNDATTITCTLSGGTDDDWDDGDGYTLTPDFESTALHTDASGAGTGRFAIVADGHVAYCNEKESYIWAGEEQRVAALFTVDSDPSSGTPNPVDWTEEANNTLDDSSNRFTVDEAAQEFWIIFTTRPAKGFNYTIKTANAIASSTTAIEYWDGNSFTAVSGSSDGTSSGGISLAQSGSMTFTEPAVKPFHLEGVYLYAYLMEINSPTSDASAVISNVTADIDWQAMTDVWDGVYRQPIQFQFQDDTKWEDYTLEVNTASTADQAYVADIADFAQTNDEIVIMFEERIAGIRFELDSSSINTTSSNLTVKYWDGDSFETVGTSLRDETDTTPAFGQTGLISWSPEDAAANERAVTKFGTKGYAYQITTSATHNAGKIDIVTGIPAQITVKPFKFASVYKNRTMLCGYTEGKEGSRCDFSLTNAPDVFNGFETSMDGLQSLYFGGSEPLTAGTQLFNRFGSNVFAMWIGFKDGETYVLRGDGPEDFKVDLISSNIGCPAPMTLTTAEVGYELTEGVYRNVAIWLSSSGPMIFDGGVLSPIAGIDSYFDPAESNVINFDQIGISSGWYDPVHKEYNLLIPLGTATVNDEWLVYDIVRKKWYTKDTGTASTPQVGFQAIDDYGTKSIYAGVDDGRLVRLDNGNSWDGVAIEQILVTGDFWPTGSIWDKTRIRRLKLVAKRINESHIVDVLHFSDGESVSGYDTVWADTTNTTWADTTDTVWAEVGGAPDLQINLSSGTDRFIRSTKKTNLLGWSHGFRFEVSTSDTTKGFQPLGLGLQYQYVREDL